MFCHIFSFSGERTGGFKLLWSHFPVFMLLFFVVLFLHEKCNDLCSAGRVLNINVTIFSLTMNDIDFELCIMVVLKELYMFKPLWLP